MKIFKSTTLLGLVASVSLFFVSCKKNDAGFDNTSYTLSGSATGAQVVPTVNTNASGNITGSYNGRTNVLMYNVTFTGLSASVNSVNFFAASDFSTASAGANSTSAQFHAAITQTGMTGAATGSVTLSEAQEIDLLNGRWYYTVGNTTYMNGEIRGRVIATAE
jgi:hypothetical protein